MNTADQVIVIRLVAATFDVMYHANNCSTCLEHGTASCDEFPVLHTMVSHELVQLREAKQDDTLLSEPEGQRLKFTHLLASLDSTVEHLNDCFSCVNDGIEYCSRHKANIDDLRRTRTALLTT